MSGADPDTTYYWAMDVDGVEAAAGEVTTAPPEGSGTQMRFGFGSCSSDPAQPIFQHILDADLDAFLFVGDAHYADTSNPTLLRRAWQNAHRVPLRKDLLASVPTLAVPA